MRKKINLPKISPYIGNRIKKLRESVNPSQKSFAEILGWSNTYLSDIERGRTKPSLEFLISISENTKCDLNWLLTGEDNMYKKEGPFGLVQEIKKQYSWGQKMKMIGDLQKQLIRVRPIPILNTVPAGFPETPIEDNIIDWVWIPVTLKDKNAFALIVTGKSMYPKIDEGEIVIISPKTKVASGQIGVFRINNDVTIKKLLIKDGTTYLISENTDHPPIILKDGVELEAIGLAVYQVKKIQ